MVFIKSGVVIAIAFFVFLVSGAVAGDGADIVDDARGAVRYWEEIVKHYRQQVRAYPYRTTVRAELLRAQKELRLAREALERAISISANEELLRTVRVSRFLRRTLLKEPKGVSRVGRLGEIVAKEVVELPRPSSVSPKFGIMSGFGKMLAPIAAGLTTYEIGCSFVRLKFAQTYFDMMTAATRLRHCRQANRDCVAETDEYSELLSAVERYKAAYPKCFN